MARGNDEMKCFLPNFFKKRGRFYEFWGFLKFRTVAEKAVFCRFPFRTVGKKGLVLPFSVSHSAVSEVSGLRTVGTDFQKGKGSCFIYP